MSSYIVPPITVRLPVAKDEILLVASGDQRQAANAWRMNMDVMPSAFNTSRAFGI
jgi:hypothetical protein